MASLFLKRGSRVELLVWKKSVFTLTRGKWSEVLYSIHSRLFFLRIFIPLLGLFSFAPSRCLPLSGRKRLDRYSSPSRLSRDTTHPFTQAIYIYIHLLNFSSERTLGIYRILYRTVGIDLSLMWINLPSPSDTLCHCSGKIGETLSRFAYTNRLHFSRASESFEL